MASSPRGFGLAQHFYKSMTLNGGCPFLFELCTTDGPRKPIIPDAIITEFPKHSHIYHPPVRWMVEPKADVILFADYDILVCDSLSHLFEDTRHLQYVQSLKSHLTKEEWIEICQLCDAPSPRFNHKTYDGKDSPMYPNFGFLVMPKDLFEEISKPFIEALSKVMMYGGNHKLAYQFAPQIALAVVVAKHDIPTKELPLRCNFPDLLWSGQPGWTQLAWDFIDEEKANMKACHLMSSKYTNMTDYFKQNQHLKVAQTFLQITHQPKML